jgi:hypothetical protein
MKVATRNNLIRKLTGTTWGATNPQLLRTTALALCYSAGEYAYPVWSRSCHAKKVDVALNETCHLITGCQKPTPIPLVQILAGIASPDIRRSMVSDTQKTAQANDERHPLHGYQSAPSRLKSRKIFLKLTTDITTSLKYERRRRWISLNQTNNFKIKPMEKLPPGYRCEWNT